MEIKTIASIKADIKEFEEEIAYLQRRRQELIDELWDAENPVDPETQAIEDAIDEQ